MSKLFFIVVLFLAVTFVSSTVSGQGYVQLLPDEITAPYYLRYEAINTELKTLEKNEWAGTYSLFVGETWSQAFIWSSENGFVAFRDTCSNGPRAWINYGHATLVNGKLNITAERSNDAEYLLNLDTTEFTAVKWGVQHWLVPTNELTLFAYAINSRSGIEREIGYLKGSDYEKEPSGQPNLPDKFMKLLGAPKINAKVISVLEKNDAWYPPLKISAGRMHGVIKGMNFWLTGHDGIVVRVEVDSVDEETSIVKARLVGINGEDRVDTTPKMNWRFTNQPEDSEL